MQKNAFIRKNAKNTSSFLAPGSYFRDIKLLLTFLFFFPKLDKFKLKLFSGSAIFYRKRLTIGENKKGIFL
jgi:hypothetical protein